MPGKRLCCAVLGQPELHKNEDIYICGLPECRTLHPEELHAPGPGRPLTPYLPLCGAHRALAEVKGGKGVLVYVDQGIGRFRL